MMLIVLTVKRWHKRCCNNYTSNYLSNFWRTLEMPLMNCEISLMLNWSEKCFLVVILQQIKSQNLIILKLYTKTLCSSRNFINSIKIM